jgi:phage shock protein PspC (stress-responsive transcriptional regulator)
MTPTSSTRRLYRSRSDRMLGGVAGGLASYLQVDPTLTRLAFAALVLAAGSGLLAYIIAWIVVPEEPEGRAAPAAPALPTTAEEAPAPGPAPLAAPAPESKPAPAGRGARLIVGAVLIALGTLFLLDWALPDLHHYFWPAAIIVCGLVFLAYGARR